MKVTIRGLSTKEKYLLVFRGVLLALLLAGAHGAYADITQEQVEADCRTISNLAAQGDRLYTQKHFARAREFYEKQVAWSQSCQLDESAIATAYNNVALTYAHEGTFLKAKAWLAINANSPKSVFNLKKYAAEIEHAASMADNTLEGEYWSYVGMAMWNVVNIKRNGTGYKVWFDGLTPGMMAMYVGPNLGSFEADVHFDGGKALYTMASDSPGYDCTFTLTVQPGGLKVDQTGDYCGFGHNVYAGGKYVKVSSKPDPKPLAY